MIDRWLVFVVLQFVSAAIGFAFWYLIDPHHNTIFLLVAGFFFTFGTFGATRWGFDKWRGKNKPRKREKRK
ncbi:MAG: hypothetical protein ABI342_05945 [Nitrososphaera sp.]|jgi:hypothetical protein